MSHTFSVPDVKNHGLAPDSRLAVRFGPATIPGKAVDTTNARAMVRYRQGMTIDANTISAMQDMARTKKGRRKLCSIMYRNAKLSALENGKSKRQAIAIARRARFNGFRMLKQIGMELAQQETYARALQIGTRYDRTSPLDSCFIPAKDIPETQQAQAGGIGGVFHYRKPGGGDVFCKPTAEMVSVPYAKNDIQTTDTIQNVASESVNWENTSDDTE